MAGTKADLAAEGKKDVYLSNLGPELLRLAAEHETIAAGMRLRAAAVQKAADEGESIEPPAASWKMQDVSQS